MRVRVRVRVRSGQCTEASTVALGREARVVGHALRRAWSGFGFGFGFWFGLGSGLGLGSWLDSMPCDAPHAALSRLSSGERMDMASTAVVDARLEPEHSGTWFGFGFRVRVRVRVRV